MQAIMVLILGATIGLAAFVERRKVASAHVVLDEPREMLDLSIRLPMDWEGIIDDVPNEPGAAAIVKEPRNHRGQRTVSIVRLTSDKRSAHDFLKSRAPDATFQPFQFLDLTGEIAKSPITDPKSANRRAGARRTTLSAAVNPPSGGIVLIEVQTPPSLGRSAEILLNDVAAAIELNDTPATRPVGRKKVKSDDRPEDEGDGF